MSRATGEVTCFHGMKKDRLFTSARLGGLAGLLALSLTVTSCYPPQPHQVPFVESDFLRSSSRGSGAVVGQCYIEMTNHTIKFANDTVCLVPVNAYTEEMTERMYPHKGNMEAADPRYHRYVRKVEPDTQGRFAFYGLPAGEYYVTTAVSWKDHVENSDANGQTYTYNVITEWTMWKQITVRDGQTLQVNHFNDGQEWVSQE